MEPAADQAAWSPPSSPVISVVLLVRNGMPGLGDTLTALAGQTGCEPFEIVAVDSGSTDGSLEALAAVGARVERIDPATFSFGPTRQRAFELTRGQVIVTLSQDAVPAGPGWLAMMTGPILAGACDLVQGDEQVPVESRRLAMYHQTGTAYAAWPMPWVAVSCSGLAISRAAWLRTGFGTVPMSEDKYLALAARRLDLRLQIACDVPLLHGHIYTVRSLAKRAFNEGMGARWSDGRYTFRNLLRDLTRWGNFRRMLSDVFKYRSVSVSEATQFPIRPVFLYLGYRFGHRYWR